MLVKLLNVDLIRTFGGSTVEMSEPQAKRYVQSGKGIIVGQKLESKKAIHRPSENKAMFSPPEEKLFDSTIVPDEISNENPYPQPKDFLFPQINN